MTLDLEAVASRILEMGFRIEDGPFENVRYGELHGTPMVRIKTVLTRQQIEDLGLVIRKPDQPGNPRSIRFLVQEDGGALDLRHISSSLRKSQGPRTKRRVRRRKEKAPE
jgi:hypothetical protein